MLRISALQKCLKGWKPFALPVLFLLCALACQAPGEGKKAQAGFDLCVPLIAALDNYYERYGIYPDTLDALIPEFVEQVPERYDGIPIVYEKTEDSYWLRFSYEGPGINHCIYTPQELWLCEGYF